LLLASCGEELHSTGSTLDEGRADRETRAIRAEKFWIASRIGLVSRVAVEPWLERLPNQPAEEDEERLPAEKTDCRSSREAVNSRPTSTSSRAAWSFMSLTHSAMPALLLSRHASSPLASKS